VKIDLGCGPFKKAGYVGIDEYDWTGKYPEGEFILGHVPEVFAQFKGNSIQEVRACHFLEHIPQSQVIETMNEVYRILVAGGLFDIIVPKTPCDTAWCDPFHVSFWNKLSFRYYDKSWCSELTDSYGIKCNFKPDVYYESATEGIVKARLIKV
jgi:hypothetical protein